VKTGGGSGIGSMINVLAANLSRQATAENEYEDELEFEGDWERIASEEIQAERISGARLDQP
jgi:hypothetical protein